MTSLVKSFDDKAAPPALMDAQTYRAMLEKLVAEGQGYGKTQNVGAFLLQDIKLVTETNSGKDETSKNISVEKLYIIMDLDQYPNEIGRNLVVKDIAKNWGGKIVRERDLESPDFKGPGLWTNKKGAFEGDYMKADPSDVKSSLYVPDPNAYRVTLITETAIKMPVQWGDFTVEAGGAIAVREKDIPALAEALQSIRDGKATAEEALYAKDKEGKSVAKFDIYGMMPGFLEASYKPVPLKPETEAIAASFEDKDPTCGTRAMPRPKI